MAKKKCVDDVESAVSQAQRFRFLHIFHCFSPPSVHCAFLRTVPGGAACGSSGRSCSSHGRSRRGSGSGSGSGSVSGSGRGRGRGRGSGSGMVVLVVVVAVVVVVW